MEDFKHQAHSKNLKLQTELPPELSQAILKSDFDLIRKIFHHLLSNALKFTERGTITVGLTSDSGYLKFFVRDTGIGIAAEALEYIFDSFMQEDFSSTRTYEGSGLGLSIVKGIVTLLKGEVTLDSVKGEGATFYFTIPTGEN